MDKKTNKKEDNRLLLGSVRMPDVSNPTRDEVFKRRSAVSDDWEPSKELLDAIKSYEKFSPVVYKDGNGVETIGYGTTDKKIIAKYRGGKRMSKREAERLFNRHVDDVIAQMKDSIPNFSSMSNNQKDAMTSYVYNVGIGSVTRKSPKLMEALEEKNWKEVAKQMDFGYNDEKNSGLRKRRDEEQALFTAYLDMGLEEPTEEELAAAHARMQQNALEDILSSRNELELQDPLRTDFNEAYRIAVKRKQPTFTWNGREFATDLKAEGGPTSPEEEQAIISRVNQSKADFIQRLLSGNSMYIPDWEKKGNISTHKLRAEIDKDGNAIVFPIVQNIDGKLYDFSDPANGRSFDNEDYVWRAMDSAIARGDTVRFNNIGEAIWFADNNYKRFYDSFKKPDGGPVLQRDAIQSPANPTMDFMNLIGESIPYDAGELPGVTVTAERTYDGGTLPEVIVEAINKRRREHELPELTMDVYFDAVANIVREENKRRKNISLPELTMDDYIASLDNIRIGSEKPNPNKKGEVKINPDQYTSIINGLIPVWGDIQDAADFFEAMQNDDSMGQIIALTGLVPFIGGSIKATIGNMAKGVAVNYAQENRKPDGGYIAPRDATTVGAPEPNPNAPDITSPSSGVDISEIVAGGIPIIGDVMDVRDFLKSAKDRDAVGMFLSGIGLIPVFGGFGKQMLNTRRIPNNLTSRDKELLDVMPEYANPNSPAGEAWLNHKKRLISGAYKRLVGEDLILHNGEIDPSQLDTKVYDALDPVIIEEAKRLEMTDYTEDEIKEILENEEGYFIVGSKIAKGKMDDIPKEELFGQMKDMTDEEIEDMMKSHEIEHLVHYPDKAPSKDAFSIDRIIEKEDLTDDQKEELRRYFKQASGTELSARGTQIKDYFGLTNDSQEVTPEMLEYASRHYIEDYGDDNMMSLFFDGIVDYKKMAKWITDHASVGLGVYFLNEAGQRVTQDELEEKKQGGFVYHSQKPHKGDPEIGDVLRYRSHKFYIYGGKMNKNDKKQNGGSVSPITTFNLKSQELPTVEHIMDVVSDANRESMDPIADSIIEMGYVPYIRSYFKEGGANSDGILNDYFKRWNEWMKRPRASRRKNSFENASELTKIQNYYRREVVPSLKKKMDQGGYTEDEIKELWGAFTPSGETPGADSLDALMGTIQEMRYNAFNASLNDIRLDENVRSAIDGTIRSMPPEDFLIMLRNTNGFGADYAKRLDKMPDSDEKDEELYRMRDIMARATSYAPIGLGAAYYNNTSDEEVTRQMGGLVQHWGDRDWGPDEPKKTPEQIKAELDERYKITPDMPEADRLMMLNLRSFQEGGELSNEYKVKYLYDLLLNEAGMSQNQALAVLGNLWGESHWSESASGDTNTSYGIQQWHGDRRKKLIEFAKNRSGNEEPTFWDQAHFLVKEYREGQGFLDDNSPVKLDGYLSYSKHDFQNAESLHDAVVAWNQGFGRPHKKVMRTEDRYKGALKAAEMLGITVDENMPSFYGINGISEDPIVPAFDSFAATATKPSGTPAATSLTQNTGEDDEDIPTVPGIENMTQEERQKLWFETYGKQMVEDYIAEENRVRREQEDARRLQYQQQAEEQAKRDAEAAEQARRQAIIEQALDEAMLNIPGMARGK